MQETKQKYETKGNIQVHKRDRSHWAGPKPKSLRPLKIAQ